MRICRRPLACMIVAIVAWLASAPHFGLAQLGQSSLSWQQRFLGILPLVKPDPKDPVLVTVNGAPITAAEIADYANTEKKLINATSTEESRAVFKDATENLINRQLLLQEAEKRKISIPDAEVAQRAREFQVAGASGQAVANTGAPDEQLMKAVRGSMEIEKMLDDEFRARHVQPTDAQIEKYYQEHSDLFVKDPGEVQIAHIAVKLPPNATDAQKKAGSEKIVKLYKEAGKSKDFAAFAKNNSEDTQSSAKGGDLGYFHPGQLPPVIDKMVFSTPVGHLTPIVESNLGFSFIKVTARRGETIAPLKEMKAKVAMVLLDYNEDAVVKEMVRKIAKTAKIDFKKTPRETS
ncbi:MAG: PpiC-type peptidyl-prolyl cis-trans isomerase [Candidatus Binatus sp.]|jgi:parvulin-like peptidyl-prolyl isomerase|nr:PpiC-type peptidyl-prolyl cis-trans isomerase [Candidatus Binatus sp.]